MDEVTKTQPNIETESCVEKTEQSIVQPKKRDNRIDIIRAICIVLMVLGHAVIVCGDRGTSLFVRWISLFHMPAFFIASGFFWKDSAITDGKSYLKYLWKKVKTLYLPYVLINVAFLILNNFFVSIYFYPESMRYDSFPIKEILGTFIFLGSVTSFGGATWFLRALFVASVVQATIRLVIKNLKARQIIQTALAIACLITYVIIKILNLDYGLMEKILTVIWGYGFIVVGIIFKANVGRFEWSNKIRAIVSIISLVLLVGATFLMEKVALTIPILDGVVGGIIGWVMLWCVANIIDEKLPKLTNVLSFIGVNTLFIVLWHFFFFKPTSLVYLLIKDLPLTRLAENPVLVNESLWLGIFYTIISLALCLLLAVVYKWIKTKIINLIKKEKAE